MRILQCFFAMVAFATCANYTATNGYKVQCTSGKTVSLNNTFYYPFRYRCLLFSPGGLEQSNNRGQINMLLLEKQYYLPFLPATPQSAQSQSWTLTFLAECVGSRTTEKLRLLCCVWGEGPRTLSRKNLDDCAFLKLKANLFLFIDPPFQSCTKMAYYYYYNRDKIVISFVFHFPDQTTMRSL